MFASKDFVDLQFEQTSTLLQREGVELVKGDIANTINVLRGTPLLLTFLDTDNYTPTMQALPILAENTIVGGSIVLDHYFALEEYNDALGDGLAAAEFFREHPEFLNLSGTGVFVKLP